MEDMTKMRNHLYKLNSSTARNNTISHCYHRKGISSLLYSREASRCRVQRLPQPHLAQVSSWVHHRCVNSFYVELSKWFQGHGTQNMLPMDIMSRSNMARDSCNWLVSGT